MHLRLWQQEIIDSFPSIVDQHRRFILKAPTGAGKTVLASEIVERFYAGKKIVERERAVGRSVAVCAPASGWPAGQSRHIRGGLSFPPELESVRGTHENPPRIILSVLSDECEPVSAGTVALSIMPHKGRATRRERRYGSA